MWIERQMIQLNASILAVQKWKPDYVAVYTLNWYDLSILDKKYNDFVILFKV